MSQSLYDVASVYDDTKMKSDVLYNAFMSRDTTDLDRMVSEIIEITKKKHPQLSSRFQKMADRTVSGSARIAKHAFLLFGLFMEPEYAKSLVMSEPKVDPVKFQLFYTELPKLCGKLQNGIFTSMQEFVEDARTLYIIT